MNQILIYKMHTPLEYMPHQIKRVSPGTVQREAGRGHPIASHSADIDKEHLL